MEQRIKLPKEAVDRGHATETHHLQSNWASGILGRKFPRGPLDFGGGCATVIILRMSNKAGPRLLLCAVIDTGHSRFLFFAVLTRPVIEL